MADSKNIYLLTGEELLKERFIEELIDRHVPEEARELNVDYLSGEEITANNLMQRATTLPLFSEHRVIIVKEIEKLKKSEQEKLADVMGQIPSSTILILSANDKEGIKKKLLDKIKDLGIIKNLALPHSRSDALIERKRWIREELKKMGSSIDERALDALVGAPMELRQLRSELEKLATYARGRTITLEDVHTLLTSTQDVKIYQFTNAVFGGNIVEAMRLLDLLLETGDMSTSLILIHSLANQARILLQMKILQEAGVPLAGSLNPEKIPSSVRQMLLEGEESIIQFLQVRHWLLKELSMQAMRFSKGSLHNVLRLLLNLDIEIKLGADPREKLEWFILRVAGTAPVGEKSSADG